MGMSIDFSVIVFKLVIITFKLSEGEIQPTYINFIRVHVKCLVSIFIWSLIQLMDRVKFFNFWDFFFQFRMDLDKFHFRWSKIKGFDAVLPISITLFCNYLN